MATPQRIAIDLQTPPGATVTVFFSQSNSGQLRAQMSANDPGAMQWLQQQVATLRQNETGPSVVWLPPQMDQSNNSNQNPSGNQQKKNQNGTRSGRSDEDRALADSIFGVGGTLSSTNLSSTLSESVS